MNVDTVADRHLKRSGRALREDDELRLVAELIDASVKEHLGVMGTDKVPTPLSQADITTLAEVMAKCAYEAVSAQMTEMREQISIMSDQLAFVTNAICKMDARRTEPKPARHRLFGLF